MVDIIKCKKKLKSPFFYINNENQKTYKYDCHKTIFYKFELFFTVLY